jgi:hypothetical protein
LRVRYDLTIERAGMLLGHYGNGDPGRVIDLAATSWCDK